MDDAAVCSAGFFSRAVVLFEEYERALAFIDTLPAPDRATIDLDEPNLALQAAG